MVSAQELAHNAGDGAHRDDRYCTHYLAGVCDWWKYNTMCCATNGVYVPDLDFWFGAATSDLIRAYSYPQQTMT